MNTALLGLSIDSNPSHLAWMYDIYCMTGIVLPFPIIADRNGTNWMPGQPVIQPPPRTFPLLQERLDHIHQNHSGMHWYLAFQEPKQECLDEKTGDDN